MHRVTAYNRDALWNDMKRWFNGGEPATGTINPLGSATHTFRSDGGATWKIYPPSTTKEKKIPLAWKSFATPFAPDPLSYGYRWNDEWVKRSDTANGSLVTLPENYHLFKDEKKTEWVVVAAKDVPADTCLIEHQFLRPHEKTPEPYVTPDDPESCWTQPGPAAGLFQVGLGLKQANACLSRLDFRSAAATRPAGLA